MSAPLVSILIPCHNAECYLRATVDSALAQTHPATEIILVDDGSTDQSPAIARAYESRGVRVLVQSNRGASAARNAAFAASRGDWIQFLDADDLLHPNKIAAQLAGVSAASTRHLLTSRWARFKFDLSDVEFPVGNPLFADLSPREYFLRYASNDCMMHPAAWLLPRALAKAASPWDERLSLNDDGEYFARAVALSTGILHRPEAISYYRSGLPSSLSGQRSRRHLESAFLAANLCTGHFLRLDNGPEMRTAAADLLQRFAYDYYPAAPDLVTKAEALARETGKAQFSPLGGKFFRIARRFVGWKCARRLQISAGRFAAPSH